MGNKEYQEPCMSVLLIDTTDVIRTSQNGADTDVPFM